MYKLLCLFYSNLHQYRLWYVQLCHNFFQYLKHTGKNYGIIEHTKDDIEGDLNKIDTTIYTSGLGGLFKPGIPIGKIYKDTENKVDFFSDFTQLNYIKITSFSIGDKN